MKDFLETGSPLQNLIWGILPRSNLRPILMCGDIEEDFLQIRIRECERDVLCFHCVNSLKSKIIKILRFTRLVFGLTQSPFECYRNSFDKLIRNIENDTYVDDLVTGSKR